ILCIGGVVAAKCVDDPALADDLRRAAHRQALRTAGWMTAASGRERKMAQRGRETRRPLTFPRLFRHKKFAYGLRVGQKQTYAVYNGMSANANSGFRLGYPRYSRNLLGGQSREDKGCWMNCFGAKGQNLRTC